MLLPLDMDLVDVALGRRPADSVIVGGRIVNTFTGEVYPADVAVLAGRIAAVGDVATRRGPDTEVIDAADRYLVPGFFDGHQHVEDSRMSITSFSDAVVPHGTTSIYTGFDHIAVTAGLAGVRSFLDEAAPLPLNVFWGSPFRLPYTNPESAVGHRYGAAEHEEAQRWAECIGIWELTPDFLVDHDADTIAGLRLAHANRLGVFGSVPMAAGRMDIVAAHVAAGLRVDHEAYTEDEILAKLRLGLHVLLRDSPVEHFLPPLIGLLVKRPELSSKVGLCTDQANAADVAAHGHIDRLVREAITAGVSPVAAIQMATINTATIYRVDHVVGSLAPGRLADILLLSDLETLKIESVLAKGRVVARGGEMSTVCVPPVRPASLVGPFDRTPVRPDELTVTVAEDCRAVTALTMTLTDNAFVREGQMVDLAVTDRVVQADPRADVAFIAYVGRFARHALPPAVAFVSGFGLAQGAIASSCTPDDDNILCVGIDTADMALAINTLIREGGGDIVVAGGEVLSFLPLPVGGIVSDLPPAALRAAQEELDTAFASIGGTVHHPFMYLGVLCITAIPEYGMSDRGLVEAASHQVVGPVLTLLY